MSIDLFLPILVLCRYNGSESDVSEATVHVCEDVAIADETVELACHSSILTGYEIRSQKCPQHMRRNVIHIADRGRDDGKPTAMRTGIHSLLKTASLFKSLAHQPGKRVGK